MSYPILILESKLKELREKRVRTRKYLRMKPKEGDFLLDVLIRWHHEEKEQITALKKAIKILKKNSHE